MSVFIVTFPKGWFLKGTTATADVNRATRFPSEEAARASLRENKFIKPVMKKTARILPWID
jgi:hypothetical protein